MDPKLLQQFRQQLATWIETRLEEQRLPFQRLELCPRTLTDQGSLFPDLVLWINRDSQLAGSVILLPDVIDDQILAKGVSLSKALGLGHFTVWAAHEVSIWEIISGEATRQQVLLLPPTNRVTPEDFQETLDELLKKLKVVTVTCAPPTTELSAHYFANLCLHTLQKLAPGLTISARMTAGQTAGDEWVEQAPLEKAWLSLWRILFLLWQERLPPGLQPERLESAIHYALAELTKGQLAWLDIQDSEPPLPESDAVRLHHLASRLKQLRWPHSYDHGQELISILLHEVAHDLNLETPQLPWPTDATKLWVACQPPRSAVNCSLVAPRAYLAGWVFKTALQKQSTANRYAETLQSLDTETLLVSAIALLQNTHPLDRKQRDARLMLLRQAWPSRRFHLPRNAPDWLWDALYLAGLVSEELSLLLPQGWHHVPGILNLWTVLIERYQLAEITESEAGVQSLRFVQFGQQVTSLKVHRNRRTIEIPYELLATQKPGTTQIWLKASDQVVAFLCNQSMTGINTAWLEEAEALTWGLYLFLRTRLGRHLWAHCSGNSFLPEFNATVEAIRDFGVPIPRENILADLSLSGSVDTLTVPEAESLERELASILGPIPELPESPLQTLTDIPRIRHKSSVSSVQIAEKVFLDGIPRFPEHYLMHIYRPALFHYDLCGPLEIAEEFFDRILLRTIGQDHVIEVSGKIVAEALILASYANNKRVSLPEDETLLEELVVHYRADLTRLRDNLMSECRRVEPHRQAAIKIAKKIWRQQGLPPESVHKSE